MDELKSELIKLLIAYLFIIILILFFTYTWYPVTGNYPDAITICEGL